jgi:hypothetical protein
MRYTVHIDRKAAKDNEGFGQKGGSAASGADQ